ncbi:hypothetical protein GJ744_009555 [Endocarpon pusillum]|uniref:Uncharacterized protein n=1 Tax=Endocarpon pusillum TaxID=364733 RepID=A0A8H7AIP5_9EURO|nr:hypothetical protein GJ744_009555 [Endocarpon pusillum]
MPNPQDSSSSSVPAQRRRSGQSQTHRREARTMQSSGDNGSPSRETSSDASSFGQNSRISESSLDVNAPNSPTQVEDDDPAASPFQTSFGNDYLQGIGGDSYPPGQEHLLDLSYSSDPSAQAQSTDSGENNAAQADGTVKFGENKSKK